MNLVSDFIEIERQCDYIDQVKWLRHYYEEKLQEMDEAKQKLIFRFGYNYKLIQEKIDNYNKDMDQIREFIDKLDYNINKSIAYNIYYNTKPKYVLKIKEV